MGSSYFAGKSLLKSMMPIIPPLERYHEHLIIEAVVIQFSSIIGQWMVNALRHRVIGIKHILMSENLRFDVRNYEKYKGVKVEERYTIERYRLICRSSRSHFLKDP
jgi:3-deoxy-D-manno-octulosonic-acid transferase